MLASELSVLHVAGVDMHLRLPSILKLRERGVNISAAGSGDSKLFDEVGIPFFRYPLSRGASPMADRTSRKALAKIIEWARPNVVHGFSTKPCVLVPPVARAAGVSAVLRTVCGLGYLYSTETMKAKLMRVPYLMMHRQASRAANFTIFQNEDDKKLFESKGVVGSDRCTLIPGSGVDIETLRQQLPNHEQREQLKQELRIDGDGPVVIMISRLVKQKGVDHYLQSAREVKEQYPNAHFLLVGPVAGEGGQAVSLKTIETYSDSVSYLGYRTDIPALLSMADVFVLPSRYREGVPRVLMEAAALGLALVTTNMPGCRDVVLNEDTGLMIEPGDQPALTTAIRRLVQEPQLRENVGNRAFERIQQRFEVNRVVDAYLDIYGRALGEPIEEVRRRAA